MTEKIPPNFDKPWFDSDIILITENAGEKLLYANKTVLSVFSPIMRAMFFHGFKEANQDSVEIHFDYEAMKEILRILFQVEHPYSLEEQKEYDANMLMEMYKAADFYDFASIRKMCIDQMRLRPSVDMAFVAMEVDLHDIMMEMLTKKLTKCDVEKFMSRESSHRRFSRQDVLLVYKAQTGEELDHKSDIRSEINHIEDVFPEVPFMRIDLTKKWFASDVAILTKNSAERVLYANKGALASASEYFRQLFFDEKMLLKEQSKIEVDNEHCDCLTLDYNYTTVKMILSIQHCNADYIAESSIEYNTALIYDMYCAAAKEHLDMPGIQNFCIAKLQDQCRFAEGVEVAAKLNLDVQEDLMESAYWSTLLNWVTAGDTWLSYDDGDKVVDISSRQIDPILSLNHLRIVIKKLQNRPGRVRPPIFSYVP